MIKNIIFDIGNVLTDFRWEDFLKEKGITGEEFDKVAKISVRGPYWQEFDRGIWSDEQILESFISLEPEMEETIHRAFDNISGIVVIRDYACEWIKSLKESGYKVYYLSNFSKKAEAECPESLEFIELMDGGILSYKDKLIKPDHAIYELLLSRYGLKADECVFFDDMEANVKAANELGIHGIQFIDKKTAEEQLLKLVNMIGAADI